MERRHSGALQGGPGRTYSWLHLKPKSDQSHLAPTDPLPTRVASQYCAFEVLGLGPGLVSAPEYEHSQTQSCEWRSLFFYDSSWWTYWLSLWRGKAGNLSFIKFLIWSGGSHPTVVGSWATLGTALPQRVKDNTSGIRAPHELSWNLQRNHAEGPTSKVGLRGFLGVLDIWVIYKLPGWLKCVVRVWLGDWQTYSIKGQLVSILSLHSQWSLAHLFNFAIVWKQPGTYRIVLAILYLQKQATGWLHSQIIVCPLLIKPHGDHKMIFSSHAN